MIFNIIKDMTNLNFNLFSAIYSFEFQYFLSKIIKLEYYVEGIKI